MKKGIIIAVIIAMGLFLYTIPTIQKDYELSKGKEIKALLIYHPEYRKAAPHILAAYESVLQEEGVPYESMDVFQLINISADDLVKRVPVMILPDNLLQNVPGQFIEWVKEYLAKGGNIAVIYDVGIKHQKGYFLERSAFADIVGFNYSTINTMGDAAFDHANIAFASEASRDFFQFPLGKTVDRVTLSGYGYGALEFPVARNEVVRSISESDIYAYAITAKQEKFPAIVLTDYGKGKVLYVNLPLGHLKANSDDLPLRSMLRTFLFDVIAMPHVMNVEEGRGGIVINWHVDSDIEHTSLLAMQERGLLRKGLRASFHITAGDFLDEPGDEAGFDAAGEGRQFTELLADYGVIGSHGGWAHNWFAENIENGVFTEKEIREYIAKNNECLEQIVGYKIVEYSAPNGVHPQPMATRILEDLGVVAYYYTGDTGSGPNRSFYEGKMLSDKTIAFPVMPFGKKASLWEMRALDGRQDSEVTEWFFNVADYAVRNRTVRLVYSHPYNIEEYPESVVSFIDKVEKMQADHELTVRPMSEFAEFFLRFLQTKYAFRIEEKQLIVSLKNPDSLTGITVALPKKQYKKPHAEDIMVQEDERYYYITGVGMNEKEKYITVDTQ